MLHFVHLYTRATNILVESAQQISILAFENYTWFSEACDSILYIIAILRITSRSMQYARVACKSDVKVHASSVREISDDPLSMVSYAYHTML